MESNTKVPFLQSFYKSQASSFLATIIDFGVYLFLFNILGLYYGLSSGLGATCGAVVSFMLGRYWAFKKSDVPLTGQAIRYGIASLLSVLINTYGMIWVTETFSISPIISKAIVAFLVGIFFNFLMFRYFVYK